MVQNFQTKLYANSFSQAYFIFLGPNLDWWYISIFCGFGVFGGGNVHFVGECVQFGKQNVHLMWRNLLSLASWWVEKSKCMVSSGNNGNKWTKHLRLAICAMYMLFLHLLCSMFNKQTCSRFTRLFGWLFVTMPRIPYKTL